MFTQLYPHNSHGGVDLAAIAKEAGACKHFCASKWAKVGGMLQMDGTTKFAGAGGVDTSKSPGPVFTNPNEYDPYRFLAPREEQRKFSHGWLGFGGGRHRCIGENFAYMQIKTIWAYLLRNFELEMEGGLPQPNYEALVVGPHHHQCFVKYKRRAAPL